MVKFSDSKQTRLFHKAIIIEMIVEHPHNAWQEQAASRTTAFRVFKELEDGCCQNQ